MLVKTFGCAIQGISATPITIEVNVDQGIQFSMVGLPDNAVKESHQRIEAALLNIGYKFPRKKIIINMAPADIRKEGSSYDLPIAIGLLAASEQLITDILDKYIIMGELSLDGSLQPIKGALPIAIEARDNCYKGFILPAVNAREAAIVNDLDVYGVETLNEVIQFLEGSLQLEPVIINTREEFYSHLDSYEFDFSDVKGQESVKRALTVSAAGGHNIIML